MARKSKQNMYNSQSIKQEFECIMQWVNQFTAPNGYVIEPLSQEIAEEIKKTVKEVKDLEEGEAERLEIEAVERAAWCVTERNIYKREIAKAVSRTKGESDKIKARFNQTRSAKLQILKSIETLLLQFQTLLGIVFDNHMFEDDIMESFLNPQDYVPNEMVEGLLERLDI